MSNESEKREKEMPIYTCEKCARTFSQKSHYTAHQKKKNDCSTQTNLAVAKAIVENEEKKEINEKYFDISDYKLYEIPDFMSYAFDLTSINLINAMAYMDCPSPHSSSEKYDGFIFYTNSRRSRRYFRDDDNRLCYDIIILEEGDILNVCVGQNKYRFTQKDIKYFPLLDLHDKFIEVSSENPVKIISFTNDIRRKVMQTKFHTNNSMLQFVQESGAFYTLDIKLPPFSDFVENLDLFDTGKSLTENEVFSLITDDKKEYSEFDGFVHSYQHTGSFVDIIVLNESVNALLRHRNEKNQIELTVKDMKYIPLYLLKDTMVTLRIVPEYVDNVISVTAITFFKDRLPTSAYDHGSFVIEDGILKKRK